MPAGESADGLSVSQRIRIERAAEQAHAECGLTFGVWIGSHDGSLREHAVDLLARTDDGSGRAVVIAVDPAARGLEIRTAPAAGRVLDDRACALGAATMTSTFASGDLVGGIEQGLAVLAGQARRPDVLHLEH